MAMPVMEADLGIKKAQLGLFLTLHGLLYGVAKLCNGMLADRANRELINQVIQQQVPGARRMDLATEDVPPADALAHPAVQAALAAFPGEVVSVRPRLPEEGETT